MCTVTWIRHVDGFELFCNRDERRTRSTAEVPRVHAVAGDAFLAPTDVDGGGTWIAVNPRGLALCLLNDYEAPEPSGVTESRGLLVRALAVSDGVEDALDRLRGSTLGRYRGFALLVLGPRAGEDAIARWDTRSLDVRREAPARPMLVSSAWRQRDVTERRLGLFTELVGDAPAEARPDLHDRLHASHRPEAGPYSPCMHRADATTVSTSRIRVDATSARFDYRPGAPCERAPWSAHHLALAP